MLRYLLCAHPGMKSTGHSIEPCLSWTAQWRETTCYATKPSRRGNRGTGRGGRDRKQKWQRMRPQTRCRWGWMLTRFTTRCSALSAPQRWPCSIKMRCTTSSTSWPATAEKTEQTLNRTIFFSSAVSLFLTVSLTTVAAFKAAIYVCFF